MAMMALVTLCAMAQNERLAHNILDKTAALMGNKGGASANFSIAGAGVEAVSGTIFIKGNCFHARTGQAMVWYNGKSQWTYLKSTNEVNITTPIDARRMRMNPYSFITIYKKGYAMSATTKGANHQVHLKAQNKQQPVQEVYLTVNKTTYKPSMIKIREGNKWFTITISGFQTKTLPNSMFSFNHKDFPSAEVIDLR